jgi:predicted HAD superfamily Cof-like phosphohydrolase
VPVTARLSQRFYEKFGDEVTNELVDWFNEVDATYRADLRELNELNYARFDAKVEQRFAQADAKLEQRFAQADAKLEQRLAQTDAKLMQFKSELVEKIAASKSELIGWMFVFWTGSVVANMFLRR